MTTTFTFIDRESPFPKQIPLTALKDLITEYKLINQFKVEL